LVNIELEFGALISWWLQQLGPCDGKEFEICTAGLEFESGRASLVRAWDSWGFTRSLEPIKCAFWEDGFSSNPKKKKNY